MKLYRVFGALHYQGSMFAPFVESNWTWDKAEAEKAYNAICYADFKKADPEKLEDAKLNQLPISIEKPSLQTMFLWIELVEVEINCKTIQPNDDILEIANYEQNILQERGLFLNGRKMKNQILKQILY